MSAVQRLEARLAHKASAVRPTDPASEEGLRRLVARCADVPLFAHSYPFILNMDHAGYSPADLAEFAYANELKGLCLHINDGADRSVSRMSRAEREAFRRLLEGLDLRLHLEISSTERDKVQLAADLAGELGVENIRCYARRTGRLSAVLEAVYGDLCHAAELANARGLHFDYEQHEDLRAAEIAGLIERVGDRRLNVLFDYTNSWNAHEEPLDALRILKPWIRQVHIKGGRRTTSARGWGQVGVPQGSAEDELPGALLLYELLMLGDERPQVIAFALENEVGYLAPPFRGPHDPPDPLIAAREPSQTLLDPSIPLDRQLRQERRWAQQQVRVNRLLVDELAGLAAAALDEIGNQQGRAAPGVSHGP
jgi:sugar phosphate isomerase/epimerase